MRIAAISAYVPRYSRPRQVVIPGSGAATMAPAAPTETGRSQGPILGGRGILVDLVC